MANYIFKVLLITLCGLQLTACAATKNLINSEFYRLETVPNSQTYMKRISAVVEQEGLKVSGVIRLKGISVSNVPKYIEVAVLSHDGQLLDLKKTTYSPRVLRNRRKRREARFSVNFRQVPPQGATIRLSNVN